MQIVVNCNGLRRGEEVTEEVSELTKSGREGDAMFPQGWGPEVTIPSDYSDRPGELSRWYSLAISCKFNFAMEHDHPLVN